MKKSFLAILMSFAACLAASVSANAECYHQRNPIGYTNYDICEVEGTGYTCVSLEGKSHTPGGIACFPTPKSSQDDYEYSEQKGQKSSSEFVAKRTKFGDRGIGEQ
jgi:hypothetical protein